jgi:TDG/mug DNA glycosylase family protein
MTVVLPLGAEVPERLRRLHRRTAIGAVVRVDLSPLTDRRRRADVLHGAGFAARPAGRAERLRTLPDVVGPGLRLLCVGLNPSLYAADTGVGFGRPGNRFWPAALAAGLATVDRDPEHLFAEHRVGMTDLVKRATVRADELAPAEYVEGLARLDRLAAWLEPAAVCLLGLDGWRRAVDRRAGPGWQERTVGGRPAYVMPNPSGLNAHVTVADLAAHLRIALADPT